MDIDKYLIAFEDFKSQLDQNIFQGEIDSLEDIKGVAHEQIAFNLSTQYC